MKIETRQCRSAQDTFIHGKCVLQRTQRPSHIFFAYNGEDTWKTKTPERWDPPDKPVPSPGPLGRFGFTTKNTAERSGTDEQKQEELLAIKEKKIRNTTKKTQTKKKKKHSVKCHQKRFCPAHSGHGQPGRGSSCWQSTDLRTSLKLSGLKKKKSLHTCPCLLEAWLSPLRPGNGCLLLPPS